MAKDKKASGSHDAHTSSESGGINTGVAIIGFLLCFLMGGGLMFGYMQHKIAKGDIKADVTAQAGSAWSDEESPVPVSAKDPVWGKRDAPVTVVLFSDFQCPFCSRVEATLDQVKTTYGPDKLRVVWKNNPLSFHPNAKPAAEAAQGVFALAGADAFWKFHSTAFKNQKDLSAENYEKWAKEAGVTDMAKFKKGLAEHTWAEKVEKDAALSQKLGANGTPASFINGNFVNGAQPFEKFKQIIDGEMTKAQDKIKAGTPKDRVYIATSTENRKNAPAQKEEEGEEKEDTKSVFKAPVGRSPMKGNPNALVTIVEFSEFQCPFCSRVLDTTKKILDEYGDKVRIVWKNEPLPFHPRAEPAAQLALEAREQKKSDKAFWDAHDKLFEIQKDLSDENLAKVAGELGLNVEKAKAAIKDHKFKKEIEADQELAEDLQASGTPHFFINGRRLVGAQPFEKFKPIIDEEIKHAQDVLAKGTPADKLYETLVKDGKGAPELEKKNVAPPPNGPFRGNAKAAVVIQEFSDFECPFCGRVEDTVKEVLKNYGDKVKFVWRDMPLPFHQSAPLASEAAREALKQKGQDGFWKMHDKLFTNQKDLKRETLDGYAKELGLNMDQWKTALDTRAHKAAVDAEANAGKEAGIQGTPAFVINGYFISGAQPYAKFRKVIERALAEAK